MRHIVISYANDFPISGLNEVIHTVHESIECGGGPSLAQAAALARRHAGEVGVAVRLGLLGALRLLVTAEHRHPLLAPVLHQRQRRHQPARRLRAGRRRARSRCRALKIIDILIHSIETNSNHLQIKLVKL